MSGFKTFSGLTLTVLIVGFVAHLFLPWWIIVIVTGLVAFYFSGSPVVSFWGGFAAGTLLWTCYAGYLNAANQGVLAEKIGQLFMGMSSFQLICISGLLGGLLGGFGALTGSLGKQLFQKPATHL